MNLMFLCAVVWICKVVPW